MFCMCMCDVCAEGECLRMGKLLIRGGWYQTCRKNWKSLEILGELVYKLALQQSSASPPSLVMVDFSR